MIRVGFCYFLLKSSYIYSCEWSPITLCNVYCRYTFPNVHSEHQASSPVSGIMYLLPFNDSLVSYIIL